MSYAEDCGIDCGPPDEMFYSFWTDKQGQTWFPHEMKTSHIENVLKLLERREQTDYKIYGLLQDEILIREQNV